MRPNRTVACAAALAFVLAGCAGGLRGITSRQKLNETQLKYAHFLRWGEYDAAGLLVQPELRESFATEIRPFAAVRLSDYEILDTQFNPNRTEATVMVSFSAYHLSRLVEHRWTEKQTWVRDPESGRWQVRPDMDTIRRVAGELRAQR